MSLVQCDPEVTRIVALDEAPPPDELVVSDKLLFVKRGPSEPWEDVFVQHGVDTAIHVHAEPQRDRAREELVNLGGARRFLEACHAVKARVVCFVGSSAAYGAFADNADYLFEGAPLRASGAFPHAGDAVRVEGLFYEFAAKHPDVCLQIVRTSPVIGPGTLDGFWVRLLQRRLYLAPLGHEPVLQLVHEDDATRAVWRLVKQERIGVFNVAGDAYVTLSQVARLLGRRVLRLPVLLLRLVVWLAWRLGRSEVPPGFVDYLLHPWLVNPTKMKADAMFVFRYDSPRALLDWLEARDEAARGGPRRGLVVASFEDDPEDLDEDELFEPEPEPEPPQEPPAEAPPGDEPPATAAVEATAPPPEAGDRPVGEQVES